MKKLSAKKHCLLEILVLLFLTSCNAKKKQEVSVNATNIFINNSKIAPDFFIDTIVQSYDVIPLETSSASLFGNTNGIYAQNERIYLFDKYNSKSIYIFSAKGKYVNKLTPAGSGPGEFKFIQACKVDQDGIHVFDGGLSKILQFDLDGRFMKEYRLPHFYKTNFIRYNNEKYLFYNVGEATFARGGYKLIAWDASRKKREKLYLPIDRRFAKCVYYIDEQHFFNYNTSPVFFEIFNDTIYNFEPQKEKLTAKFIFNFEEGKLPVNFSNDHTIIDKQEEVNNKNYAAFSGRLMELSDFLFFKYNYKKVEEIFIWDKKNKKTVANTYDLGIDTLGVRVPNWSKGFGENQIIVKYESYELIEWLKEMKKERINYASNPLAKIAASLKSDDNPVLLLITLRSTSK